MTKINKNPEAIPAITRASESASVRRKKPGEPVEGVANAGDGVAKTSGDTVVLSEDAQRVLEEGEAHENEQF